MPSLDVRDGSYQFFFDKLLAKFFGAPCYKDIRKH